jgi:hypothetical protein
MITFIDLGPRATVHLLLKVPVAMAGGGWSWGELPAYAGALAREFAYNAGECAALVRTYGQMMGRLLQSDIRPGRFEIHAQGATTGFLLGLQEWQWAPDGREFRPAGEYMCGWRDALRKYFEKTGELPPAGTFRPRMIAQSPCWVAQSPERAKAATVSPTLLARAA